MAKKLSSRELAAKKAGGSLNYKTGRVTVPAKSTPKRASSAAPAQPSYSTPEGAIGQNADGSYIMADGSTKRPMSSATNPQAMNYQPQASFDTKNFSSAKSSSSSSSSKSPSAKGVEFTQNAANGRNTLGQVFGAVTDVAKQVKNTPVFQAGATGILKTADKGMRALRPMLGINIAQASAGDGIDYSKTLGLDNYFQEGAPQIDSMVDQQEPLASFLDPTKLSSQMSDIRQAPPAPQAVDENADVWNPAPQGGSQRGLGSGGTAGGSMSQSQSMGGVRQPETGNSDKYFDKIRSQSEEAFQELMDSLSPTYQGYKDEYETELQKALMEEQNALLGRQMAYGTADSEQRDQAQAKIAGEFADKRSSFLRRLSEQEGGQRAQLGYDFAQDQQDMGMKQWQMMQQQAQQQFENDMMMLKQRSSGAKSGYSQEDINNWLDEQGQTAVDYGMTGGAREGIARRASKMFGGTPNNYINFFPNQWESGYTARPKITYKTDPFTGQSVAYDAYGNPIQ